MIKYFTDDIWNSVVKQRKKTLMIYYVILAVYLALSIGVLIWYTTLPYKDPMITLIKWIEYILSAIFIFITFLYMCIPYRRVNNFYKNCKVMKTGIKEVYEGTFKEYSNSLASKNGVDCKTLVFIEWNKYKNVYFDRALYVFMDYPVPQIPVGAKLRYVTQSNFLIEYEIIETQEEQQQ